MKNLLFLLNIFRYRIFCFFLYLTYILYKNFYIKSKKTAMRSAQVSKWGRGVFREEKRAVSRFLLCGVHTPTKYEKNSPLSLKTNRFQWKYADFLSICIILMKYAEKRIETNKYERISFIFLQKTLVSVGFEENTKYFMDFS